jgi:hypothetical protein
MEFREAFEMLFERRRRFGVPAPQSPLSSPDLIGRSSIPEKAKGYGEAAAYWIPRFRGE